MLSVEIGSYPLLLRNNIKYLVKCQIKAMCLQTLQLQLETHQQADKNDPSTVRQEWRWTQRMVPLATYLFPSERLMEKKKTFP